MSGTRVFMNEGQAITWPDMQRLADVAASSEDRVWNVVFTPQWAGSGVYSKKVVPLTPEPALAGYVHPRLVYDGNITGGVDVLPAEYVIGAPGDPAAKANVALLSAAGWFNETSQLSELYSLPATAFPSSSGSDGRVDLVYAIVESVATTGERKVKHPQTGQVLTEEITLYTSPTVSFGVVKGAEDGSFSVDLPPADTGTKWYFPLAVILLDDGAAGPWTEGTAIAQSRISQIWDGGWISRNRVQLAEAASIMSDVYSSGANGRATTPLSNRWGATISVAAVLQHKTDGTGAYVDLDTSHDWSRRMLTVRFMSILGDPTNTGSQGTTPDSTAVPPLFVDPTTIVPFMSVCFAPATPLSGYLSPRLKILSIPLDSTNKLNLNVNDSGHLQVEFKGTPLDYNSTTPVYLLVIEGSDQFLL